MGGECQGVSGMSAKKARRSVSRADGLPNLSVNVFLLFDCLSGVSGIETSWRGLYSPTKVNFYAHANQG